MKGKQIFYWLSLLLCLAVAGCSSDGEDEVTPKDEPGEEGGGEQTIFRTDRKSMQVLSSSCYSKREGSK